MPKQRVCGKVRWRFWSHEYSPYSPEYALVGHLPYIPLLKRGTCRRCLTAGCFGEYGEYKVRNSKKAKRVPVPITGDTKESEMPNDGFDATFDRALWIIGERARVAAKKAGTTMEFFWTQMNYQSLVAPLNARMQPVGKCHCGHVFVNERDIRIDYVVPPRHDQDWERLHSRNLFFLCGSCHRAKGSTPYDVWLHEQEAARVSNLESKTDMRVPRKRAGAITNQDKGVCNAKRY